MKDNLQRARDGLVEYFLDSGNGWDDKSARDEVVKIETHGMNIISLNSSLRRGIIPSWMEEWVNGKPNDACTSGDGDSNEETGFKLSDIFWIILLIGSVVGAVVGLATGHLFGG